MRIRSITLVNVRRFTRETRVDGIGDGLNVLCQPNEIGKSTLFDALQALFFKPHGSRDKEVKALQPHAGGAPEIRIEIETAEGLLKITKRWLSKPEARIERGGQLLAQADAAEDRIARLLGASGDGPSGLLWVRQGLTGLSAGSQKEDRAAAEARRDLMSSVGHEVEAMTGGRRMDAALDRCRAELAQYLTPSGRIKANGPWKVAQDRVETLTAERDRLAATAAELHDALEARRRHRRSLAELEAPEAAEERRERLTTATAAHEAATRHAEQVEAERGKVDAARLAADRARERRDALRALLTEHGAATEAAIAAREDTAKAIAARDATAADLKTARTALAEAETREKAAASARDAAERRRRASEGAARRVDLEARIVRAEAARRDMENAGAAAAQGPDEKALRHLDSLANELAKAIATRDATATQVIVRYADGRAGMVRLEGRALDDGEAVPVPRFARLEIEGIGAIDVEPSDEGQDSADVAAAETALRDALASLGVADLDEARRAAATRAEATRRLGEARAVFKSLAPEDLDPLRAALAAIPKVEEVPEGPDLAEAERELAEAEAARIAAQSAHAAATERHGDARLEATRAETAATAAEERLTRANDAMAGAAPEEAGTLDDAVAASVAAVEAATLRLEEIVRDAPDLEAAEAALLRARSVDHEAREAIARLRPEIARLDERISRGAGEAVEERLSVAEQDFTAAETDLARIDHDVAVLQRLEQALDAAKAEARDRYFAPVAAELRPLLSLLWPDAELTWETEKILPNALVRNGLTEPVEILSGGTQEQVALLVRLAFARMLAKAGRHAPVILDDALVFTDDDRIERMFDALHRQAGDLQIIVLSCRQRAFRALGGRTLHFATIGSAAEDAA